LSYTTFSYKKPTGGRYDANETRSTQTYKITTTVTNTGKMAGTEVVQLYINDPVASRVRPRKELKGVRTVVLEPGASKIVTFLLGEDELKFWSPEQGWHVEAGKIKVWVQGTSADLGEALGMEGMTDVSYEFDYEINGEKNHKESAMLYIKKGSRYTLASMGSDCDL